VAAPSLIYLPAPHDGIDLSVAPHQLPKTRAVALTNFLTHLQGKVPLRGPVVAKATHTPKQWGAGADVTTRVVPAAAIPIHEAILCGWVIEDANDVGWPWRRFDPVSITTAPTNTRWSTYNPNTNTWTAVNKEIALTSRQARLLDFVYFITNDHPATPTTTYLGKTHPLTTLQRVDPVTLVEGPIGANGPRASQAITSHVERLFVLGGTAPNTTTPVLPHSLWFTNTGADPTLLASWQTSGVSNQIVVGRADPTDYGLGIVHVGDDLLILKRRSVWVLKGSTLDTFTVKEVIGSSGLVDPRASVEANGVAYWVSEDGLRSYNGAELSHHSAAVNPLLLPALQTYGRTSSARGAVVSLSRFNQDYLLLTVGQQRLKTADSNVIAFQALYCISNGSWSMFSSTIPVDGLHEVADVPAHWIGIDGGSVPVQAIDLTHVTDPYSASVADRGRDRNSAGAAAAFPAQIKFAPMRAAVKDRMFFQRAGLEYGWQQGGAGAATWGPKVSLQKYSRPGNIAEPAGELIGTQSDVVAMETGATAISYDRVSTAWVDAFNEATDAVLQVDLDGVPSGDLHRHDIHGGMAEANASHPRR